MLVVEVVVVVLLQAVVVAVYSSPTVLYCTEDDAILFTCLL